MTMKHEDQWARMAKEVDATFWEEVFSETRLTDSVRLPPWCISTTAIPGAISICYMSEALATTVQWRADAPVAATAPELKGPQAPASMSSPAHHTEIPPLPILPMSDIPVIGTPPVGYSLVGFIVNPLHKKWDHSSNGAPSEWLDKRTHAETAEANVSSGHSTPQGEGEPPPNVPNNDTVASGSTDEHDSGDKTNHCSDKSTQNELSENVVNSDLESASGNCLTCLDTEEVAVRTAWKRFWKKVWASCSIARGCLWSKAKLNQIKDSH